MVSKLIGKLLDARQEVKSVEREVGWGEKGWEAAQPDDSTDRVERAALIKLTEAKKL